MTKIRIGIVGYGNLGRGVEIALSKQSDMVLHGIFSRRAKNDINAITSVPIIPLTQISSYKDQMDVLILCGGAVSDLSKQTPELATYFNTVDSFDNHEKIQNHFDNVNKISLENKTTSLVAMGWDPGLFSLHRVLQHAILPEGTTETFWGPGLSQGHSQVVREIPGVKQAVQYTIPSQEMIDKFKVGEAGQFSNEEKHQRTVYVVPEDNADKKIIAKTIREMPNYFSGYSTTLNFITEDEMQRNHRHMKHGGQVLTFAKTGLNEEHSQNVKFELELGSNPEFTANVLVAGARAVYRLSKMQKFGAKTIFDIPIALLSPKSRTELLNGEI